MMKESDIRSDKLFEEYLNITKQDIKKLFDFSAFETIPCPACGNNHFHEEFEKDGFHYVVCLDCGTLYANPRPTKEQLSEFYSRSDSWRFFTEKFFSPFEEARKEKIFKPRAEQFVREYGEYSKGRIGDIGGGTGLFLEELKRLWPNARVCTIEPSEDMGRICARKGIEVIPKMFEDLSTEDGRFDFLCSYELFEHLGNPKELLQKVNSVLEKDGCFLMTTLNGEGFDIQLLWEQHRTVTPPHHLNFINPRSIKILMESCGFTVESITTPGKLDWDIVENLIRSKRIKISRWWNIVSGLDQHAKEELQGWISKNNLSSHIRVVARKVRELS